MANLTSKVAGFAIDNAAGTLTDISAYVNSQDISWSITMLDDTAMGDTQATRLPGLVQPQQNQISGFVNTTTRAIFAPLIAGTSITKTVSYKLYSGGHLTGESWISDVSFSGSPDTLQTFSATLMAENGLTSTSVNPVA